jgi:hypothetical protein
MSSVFSIASTGRRVCLLPCLASSDPRGASARARLPTIRTLGVLAAASAVPEYRIGPQKGEPVHRTLCPAPACRGMREVRRAPGIGTRHSPIRGPIRSRRQNRRLPSEPHGCQNPGSARDPSLDTLHAFTCRIGTGSAASKPDPRAVRLARLACDFEVGVLAQLSCALGRLCGLLAPPGVS